MKRFAMAVMLKDDPEVIQRYEELHADPWPEVIKAGYECGIRRLYIYRYGCQLFMFVETIDDFDMDRDLAKYIVNAKTRKWDKIMRSMQEPAAGAPGNVKWVKMKEIHAIENGNVVKPGDGNV